MEPTGVSVRKVSGFHLDLKSTNYPDAYTLQVKPFEFLVGGQFQHYTVVW